MKNSFNKGKTFKANVSYLILLTLFCLFTQFIHGENIEIRPISIQFNYEPGNANDAVDISDDNNQIITGAEWTNSATKNFAYIIGNRIRKIKVKFESNYTGNMNVIINLTSDSNFKIGTICNMFIPNFNPNEMELTIPEYELPVIGKLEFTWKWDIYAMPTVSSSYCAGSTTSYTTHNYYTLLAAPKALTPIPSTKILNYACDWAYGTSEVEDVCYHILNYGFNLYYIWNLNCNQLSSDFVRLLSSLGITASLHKWGASAQVVGDMYNQVTRMIHPVGTEIGERVYLFKFHQWAEVGSAQKDPTTNASFSGTWGEYEDYMYTHYDRLTSISPRLITRDINQQGQASGCELSPHSYHYTNSNIFLDWKGPDIN